MEGNTGPDERASGSEIPSAPRVGLRQREGDRRAARGHAHSSECPPGPRGPKGPPFVRRQRREGPAVEFHQLTREQGSSGGGRSPPSAAAPHRTPGAHEARQRPEGRLTASRARRQLGLERHLGPPRGRWAARRSEGHPQSHRDHHRVRVKGQKSPALTSQRSRQALCREESPRPLSREGAKKGEERERRSFQKFSAPSQAASEDQVKKRKHEEDAGETQADEDRRRLGGSDAGKGARGLPPAAKGKVAHSPRAPEATVGTWPSLRRPAGPRPDVGEAAAEELAPPAVPVEALLTYDQPRGRESGVRTLQPGRLREKLLRKGIRKAPGEPGSRITSGARPRAQVAGAAAPRGRASWTTGCPRCRASRPSGPGPAPVPSLPLNRCPPAD